MYIVYSMFQKTCQMMPQHWGFWMSGKSRFIWSVIKTHSSSNMSCLFLLYSFDTCRCLSSMNEFLEPECTLPMCALEEFIRSVHWDLKTLSLIKNQIDFYCVCCRICPWDLWMTFMSGVRTSQYALMRWRRYEYWWALQKVTLVVYRLLAL